MQFVSDGDNDLERYRAEYLPHAQQTLDVIHVVEKLWTAGECFYAEGSAELTTNTSDFVFKPLPHPTYLT